LGANGAGIALRFRRDQGFYAEAGSISEQNVEVVKAAFEAWNAGTWMPFATCAIQT
jgi:hypothetical protein